MYLHGIQHKSMPEDRKDGGATYKYSDIILR